MRDLNPLQAVLETAAHPDEHMARRTSTLLYTYTAEKLSCQEETSNSRPVSIRGPHPPVVGAGVVGVKLKSAHGVLQLALVIALPTFRPASTIVSRPIAGVMLYRPLKVLHGPPGLAHLLQDQAALHE